MKKWFRGATLALALTAGLGAASAEAAELRGSRASMVRQHGVAKDAGYTFLRTPRQVEEHVERGELVPVEGNDDYRLSRISHPVALPETRLFIERLASGYREACGEKLVVTSLTRPLSRQPRNAHALSVHPAGMAVDLRVPADAACRSWLETTLIGLEREGVIDATRERFPPHYHIAVFPERYRLYAEARMAEEAEAAHREAAARVAARVSAGPWGPLVAAAVAGVPFADERPAPGGEASYGMLLVLTALAAPAIGAALRPGAERVASRLRERLAEGQAE